MSRRSLLAQSATQSTGGSIFPMHLTLNKINNSYYKLDPTPETIALADYILQNEVFDGIFSFDCAIPPGMLTIDGVEVARFNTESSGSQRGDRSFWYPFLDRDFLTNVNILWTTGSVKGTIEHYDDD